MGKNLPSIQLAIEIISVAIEIRDFRLADDQVLFVETPDLIVYTARLTLRRLQRPKLFLNIATKILRNADDN